MGKLEVILDIIDPLIGLFDDKCVTYYVRQDIVDIFFRSFRGGRAGNLLFRIEKNNVLHFYFILVPSPRHQFIRERGELMKKKEVVVFSGQDVLGFLGIDYSYKPKGFLEDLNELSHLIHDNSSRILKAFSDEDIENTYNALIPMEKDLRKDISDAVRHYIFIPNW